MSPSTHAPTDDFPSLLSTLTSHLISRDASLSSLPTLPTPSSISQTISSLPGTLPASGLGTASTLDYLLSSVLPGCLQAQNGPRYFGFVTGGVTPAAQLADMLVGAYDENVQVTLPGQTAATAVEARVLELVLDLIGVERSAFRGRTITTGATASNVLGLACARDHLYAHSPHIPQPYSYARDGPPSSPTLPSPPIVILALQPHFSILKAAALVGLGNGPRVVHTLPAAEGDELAFDQQHLAARLEEERRVGRGVIVVYGLGEVNTGSYGGRLEQVGRVCETGGAWLHVDAAFGGFAGAVPELRHLIDGIERADSLTLDGHKWLNVPYDTGLFYTRHATSLPGVFAPAEAPAYLSAPDSAPKDNSRAPGEVVHELVPSPLYVNIENSRRFRALPLLASLMSLGKDGYADIVRRNIRFARKVARYIHDSPAYELLNYSTPAVAQGSGNDATTADETGPIDPEGIVPLNIVLFAPASGSPLEREARDKGVDPAVYLTDRINGTRKMYVTGTKMRGRGAIRLAVSNWRTGLDIGAEQGGGQGDWEVVRGVLDEVARV